MLGYALRMTYSIVARDPHTGEMGVATQSQAFAVGSSVSWARPGAGVIATQSIGEPMYGELGLDLMRSGDTMEKRRRHVADHFEDLPGFASMLAEERGKLAQRVLAAARRHEQHRLPAGHVDEHRHAVVPALAGRLIRPMPRTALRSKRAMAWRT